MKKKQELFKTAIYQGEYVAIIRAWYNGEKFKTWRYTIRKQNGDVESQVDESELSQFCL